MRAGGDWWRFARGGALVVVGVSQACVQAAVVPTEVATPPAASGEDPRPVRRPDGVFLDPPTARPEARDVAEAGGVVALSLPLSRAEAQRLVRAYVRAFSTGDVSSFAPILAHGARRLEDGSPGDLAPSLERRLRSVDYSRLPVESAAAYEDVRVVGYDVAPEALQRSLRMRDGDVAVEVPIRLEWVAGLRLFGARVVLLLRREAGAHAWKIAGVREDDGPW